MHPNVCKCVYCPDAYIGGNFPYLGPVPPFTPADQPFCPPLPQDTPRTLMPCTSLKMAFSHDKSPYLTYSRLLDLRRKLSTPSGR